MQLLEHTDWPSQGGALTVLSTLVCAVADDGAAAEPGGGVPHQPAGAAGGAAPGELHQLVHRGESPAAAPVGNHLSHV